MMDSFANRGLSDLYGKGPGVTPHYRFLYDVTFVTEAQPPSSAPEPARTNEVIAACENDYQLMSGWFPGINVPGMINVQVTKAGQSTCDGSLVQSGACWTQSPLTVYLVGDGPQSYINSSAYLRYLLITEVTEMFMWKQNTGYWYQGGSEGSKGEGLSLFLGGQFLTQNNFLDLGIQADFGVAHSWLNSSRPDFVNIASDDTAHDATTGCTTLFIYYLCCQLGFTINQIVGAGASTLAGVYRNLTGDTGDPFPFFSQLLDRAFPSRTRSAVPGPNLDNPWPLATLSFVVDKSTFGKDEVADRMTPPDNGTFPHAFWLTLEGFNQHVLGSAMPTLSGPASSLPGVTMSPDPSGTMYERPEDQLAPQRVRFPFDIQFSAWPFPASASRPVEELLNGSIMVSEISCNSQTSFNAATMLTFVAGADPYFTNVNPIQNNDYWLSQDLRVFTATPMLHPRPVRNGPLFEADTIDAAYRYIQNLLTYLNANYSHPTGTDPFASPVILDQSGVYTGDSSVKPYTIIGTPRNTAEYTNYNFAIARVRLRGSQGSIAPNVRVFFRLWSTQTADTDYQMATYPSNLDTRGLPSSPLPAPDSHTFPFFATSNTPNLSDPNNPEYRTNGVNNKTIRITSGDGIWTYFGCFLNVYDPNNVVNGKQVQAWLAGTHHCLVAQIAYDEAPIINSNGVTEGPENSDKLAQRNLQVTPSSNPGVPATHQIPQTFDLRPSLPIIQGQDPLLQYPDELMIDWGNIPLESTASIYWPQVNVSEILQLASRFYASHLLSAADPHTIQCKVTRGVTYVPIPAGAKENLAGLLTIDLPSTVVKGQEFNVVIRRISTRRLQEEPQPQIALGAELIQRSSREQELNWRYVIGTFQVKIPVSTAGALLPAEENTLAIFKWRLQAMSPTNRWYPVLQRYIGYVSARVEGLGGDPKTIPPSLGKK